MARKQCGQVITYVVVRSNSGVSVRVGSWDSAASSADQGSNNNLNRLSGSMGQRPDITT